MPRMLCNEFFLGRVYRVLLTYRNSQIRRENLAYMGNKNTNLDYNVPQITVFDHRGCSRPPKEYSGAPRSPLISQRFAILPVCFASRAQLLAVHLEGCSKLGMTFLRPKPPTRPLRPRSQLPCIAMQPRAKRASP